MNCSSDTYRIFSLKNQYYCFFLQALENEKTDFYLYAVKSYSKMITASKNIHFNKKGDKGLFECLMFYNKIIFTSTLAFTKSK